jgi:hypothetical protein
MKPRSPQNRSPDQEKPDKTPMLTGADAPRGDAERGDAGNGDFEYSRDDIEEQFKLEGDPARPTDIAPDKVEPGFSDPNDEFREYDAKPHEEDRPITADMLPSDDPEAAQ